MDISLILRDFEYKLNLLKDFPERNMILDLTKISEIHISLAEFLSNIIAAKVVDPMTNITYKLPIFYLMDSIMKNVGGPYAALFGRHLLEIFSRTFTEVPTKDREKLDFLLGTWEERQVTCLKDRKIFMPENVLPSIREFVNTKKKTTLIADTQSNQLKRPRIETTMHGQGRAHQLPLPGPGQYAGEPQGQVARGIISDARRLPPQRNETRPADMRSIVQQNPQYRDGNALISHPSRPEVGRSTPVNTGEAIDEATVSAFVCEKPVLVSVARVRSMINRLQGILTPNITETPIFPELLSLTSDLHKGEASSLLSRTKGLIDSVYIPPPLPSVLFGPLPLQPSKNFKVITNQAASTSNESASSQPKKVVTFSRFRLEDLTRNPDKALRSLYQDRPHQYSDDGVRFKSLAELAKYTDESLTKKEASRKREISGEKVYRNWFATCAQWVSDFNALGRDNEAPLYAKSGQGSEEVKRVSVVPADDTFTRCPVSKEVFDTFWDQEEGEFMFRNAAKVLVTQAADENIFKISQPTSHPNVRYCILHKLLVLDGLIANGRADSLRQATTRYLSTGISAAKEKVAELEASIGNNENHDDIFVLLSN